MFSVNPALLLDVVENPLRHRTERRWPGVGKHRARDPDRAGAPHSLGERRFHVSAAVAVTGTPNAAVRWTAQYGSIDRNGN